MNVSDYIQYSLLPRLDFSTIETDDSGYVWGTIGHFDEDEVLTHCRVSVRYDRDGWAHSAKRRNGGGVHPSVIADMWDSVHVEYHRNGLLHRWNGPAVVHGDAKEFWLYGCCVSEELYGHLVNDLDRHRCDSDYGQWKRTEDSYTPTSFLQHCCDNNLQGAPTVGRHNSRHRRQRETTAVLEARIIELEGQLEATNRIARFFAQKYDALALENAFNALNRADSE